MRFFTTLRFATYDNFICHYHIVPKNLGWDYQ